MSFNVTAVKVAKQKRERPEWYCPVKGCLWRTGGGYCPRHEAKDSFIDMVNQDIAQPRQMKPIDPESERIASNSYATGRRLDVAELHEFLT